MVWSPGFRLDTYCEIDLTLFPFDEQICPIIVLAWSFMEANVNMTPVADYIDLTDYSRNGEWEVLDTYAARFPSGPDPEESVPGITYYVHLKRRPASHMLNIITPTLIMSLVSVLVFALPVDSGEKISLGISVLLSYSVLMLMMSEIMPRTGLMIPILGM